MNRTDELTNGGMEYNASKLQIIRITMVHGVEWKHLQNI